MNAHWHWPQWVIVGLVLLQGGFSLGKHGEPRTGNHSFWATVIAGALELWLLWSGGFFR